ncbi:aldolase/citrate lyase family protein [Coraliomargarita algicola]|uniref:Aldolase/citrate lyase family protein n=1 Tax=Coraliomargarita algicola TaxID=3092156 RepID=A0ABZ0RMT7_9BACT|nr:aldolase/citrate lyase family protein [Coraliomargarita sp. J2-16]WPJ96738.1 aldolase/citrate lyase family protein [Coraliomargarita sp. J2-16]
MKNSKIPFHQKLQNEAVFGPFSKTSDPNMIEAMGMGGMDFIILDLEHGPNDVTTLGNLVRACECSDTTAVVRCLRSDQIGQALDLGARVVQIPHVNCAADAERAVDAARFGPMGHRGVCRYVRAAGHSSTDKHDYFHNAADITVIAQVEGTEGLKNLDTIIEVPGVDMIFVGVYDLSQSLGMTGQTEAPEVVAALKEVVAKCSAKHIPVGTFVESVESARKYRSMGIHYLCYSVDVGILMSACQNLTMDMRQ